MKHKLRMVRDALSRVDDNLEGHQLAPAACAYIDGQLARAISYLASARAVAITAGSMDNPLLDDEDDFDLDEEIVLASMDETFREVKARNP